VKKVSGVAKEICMPHRNWAKFFWQNQAKTQPGPESQFRHTTMVYSPTPSPTLQLYGPTLSLCARNSISMKRIDQSHTQKASDFTITIHLCIL